jgi:hypothetical protein
MDKKVLPAADRKYLETKGYTFREINDGATSGLIIDNFELTPVGKYSVDKSSLLIVLPQGYPDVPPDMFYFNPKVLMKHTNAYPPLTNGEPMFFQIKWQQWSRHAPANEWRAFKDGIHTYLQRVFKALNEA